jgi:hypothetical protein
MHPMPSLEEYAGVSRERRLDHLAQAPSALAAAIGGRDDAALARRPDADDWCATEVICHLRDTEESFLDRFQQILAMEEPRFARSNPNRWAAERQYRRHDAARALAAFTTRRQETLALLRDLPGSAWTRAGVHLDSRGRRTIDDFVAVMAWHDDNHVDQLRRALAGKT